MTHTPAPTAVYHRERTGTDWRGKPVFRYKVYCPACRETFHVPGTKATAVERFRAHVRYQRETELLPRPPV